MGGGGGGGVFGILSDGDNQRIFFGFEIFDSRIFWDRKIWPDLYFLGGLI